MTKRFEHFYHALSEKGRRENNEDKALCKVEGNRESGNRVIVAVADGMGGLKAGDIASEIVYRRLEEFFQKEFTGDLQQSAGKLDDCIQLANSSIYDFSQKEKEGARVGTTVSGALVAGNRYLAFNVGDSRTYVINARGIRQLTIDHSADWEAYEAGLLKKEDIGRSTYSTALTRCLGTKPDVKVDIIQSEKNVLKEGDILFSSTDGLWGKVTDEEIKKVFDRENDIKKVLEILFKLALKNGSKDNISMAAYRFSEFNGRKGADKKADRKKTPAVPLPKEGIATEPKVPERKKREIKKFVTPLLIIVLVFFGIAAFLLVVIAVILIFLIINKNSKGQKSMSLSADSGGYFDPDPGTAPIESSSEIIENTIFKMFYDSERTLEMLPGRFGFIKGSEFINNIRFYWDSAKKETEFLFGRKPRQDLNYIQLKSLTISEKQAKLIYSDATYTLINYSTTNPTKINGNRMGKDELKPLEYGDTIEMGDIIIKMHQL